jgi:hypothetical protein
LPKGDSEKSEVKSRTRLLQLERMSTNQEEYMGKREDKKRQGLFPEEENK